MLKGIRIKNMNSTCTCVSVFVNIILRYSKKCWGGGKRKSCLKCERMCEFESARVHICVCVVRTVFVSLLSIGKPLQILFRSTSCQK